MNRKVFELVSSLLMSNQRIGEMKEDVYTEVTNLTFGFSIGFEKANTLSSLKWVGSYFQ